MRILIVGGGRFTERLLINLLSVEPENIYVEIVEKSQSRAEALAQLSYEVHGKPLSDYYGDSYIAVHMDALSEEFTEAYNADTLSKFDMILVATGDDMTNVRIATELVRVITSKISEIEKIPRILVRLSSEEFSSIIEMMGIESINLPMISKTMTLKEFFVRVLRDFLEENSQSNLNRELLKKIQIVWDYFKDWKRSGLVCLSLPAELLIAYVLRTKYHHPSLEDTEETRSQPVEISEISDEGITLSHMMYHSQLSPDKVRILGCKRSNGSVEIATSGDFRIFEDDTVYLLVKVPKGLDKLFEIFTGITGLIEELDKRIGEYSGVIGKVSPLVCTVKNILTGNPQISVVSSPNGVSTLECLHYSIVNKINNELRDAHDSTILFLSKSGIEDEILLRSYGLFLRMEEKGKLATQTLRIKVETPPYRLSPRLVFVTYDPVISDLIVLSSSRAYRTFLEYKKRKETTLEVSSLSVLSDGASSVTYKIIGIRSLLGTLGVSGYTILEINVPTTENSLIQAYKVTRLFSKIIRGITREISKGDKTKRMDTKIETLPSNLLEELPLQIQFLPKFLERIGMERLINKFSIIAIEDDDGTIILPDGSTNIIRPQDSYSKRIYVVCKEEYVNDVIIAFSRLFNEFPWKDVFKNYINEIYETHIKDSEKEVQEAWKALIEELKKEEIMSWLFSEE